MGNRRDKIAQSKPLAPSFAELTTAMTTRGGTGLALDGEGNIPAGKFTVTATGLIVNGEISQEDWEGFGNVVGQFKKVMAWAIGDWLALAENRFEHDKEAIAAFFELDIRTLENYVSVARAVPYARRRASLTFGHHAAVAGQLPEVQESLLAEAAAQGWGVMRLRKAVMPTPLLQQEVEAREAIPPRAVRKLYEWSRAGQGGNPVARRKAKTEISKLERWIRICKQLLGEA